MHAHIIVKSDIFCVIASDGVFAVLEKEGNDKFVIKNLKKQEIPHQTHHIEDLDLSEISFTFWIMEIIDVLYI